MACNLRCSRYKPVIFYINNEKNDFSQIMIDNSTFATLTAEYHTLGCKLNFSETGTMAQLLAEQGVRRAHGGETPDIVVVNTCSVTEEADRKCRALLRRLRRRYADALIVATGCYAQRAGDEVAKLPGVGVVLGSDRKRDVVEAVKGWLNERRQQIEVTPLKDMTTFSPSCSRGDRTRYWLKVQDGCDYYCSYCTIPRARGRSRSGTIDSLVAQAQQVAAEGGKEIVITGVNIGDFGKPRGEKFIDLACALDQVDGIERYRISSLEPDLLSDELVEFVAGSHRFMPHFHIPLQAGSDEVLKLMRRHYDTDLFARKVEAIKRAMPHAFIGVDVIAGARGETPELFEQSLRFIEGLDVTRLHVFPYSERPNTLALTIQPVVDLHQRRVRTNRLIAASTRKLKAFAQGFAGTVRPVLFEQPREGEPMHGFTDNYLRVEAPFDASCIGKVVPTRLGEIIDDDCTFSGKLAL